MGSILARLWILPQFNDFDNNFTETLAATGLLTSLFSGILITLNPHRLITPIVIRLYWKHLKKSDYWTIQIQTTKRDSIRPIIDDIYGNLSLFLITLAIFIGYLLDFPYLQIPLVRNEYVKFSLLDQDIRTNTIIFFIVTSIVGFSFWFNLPNSSQKIRCLSYYEALHNQQTNSDKTNDWLKGFIKNIPANWDNAQDLYTNKVNQINSALEDAKNSFERYCERRILMKTRPKDIYDFPVDKKDSTSEINKFWDVWFLPNSDLLLNLRRSIDILETWKYDFFLGSDNKRDMIGTIRQLKKLIEKFVKVTEVNQHFTKLQRDTTDFSNVPQDLSRYNAEWKILVISNYKQEDSIAREFIEYYNSKYQELLKPIYKFINSNSFKESSIRLEMFEEKIKLTAIIDEITKTRTDFNSYSDSLLKEKDEINNNLECLIKDLNPW